VTSLQSERINGLIEVPDLAASLTLNKGDFIRTGTRGAVSRQLEAWGDAKAGTPEAPVRMMRPLERDLDRVLEELFDDFPLLGSLVERRAAAKSDCQSMARQPTSRREQKPLQFWPPHRWPNRCRMRPNQLNYKHPLRLLTRTHQ
jgi:hypothetical protein